MILYHAGPDWLFVEETCMDRSVMAKRLADAHDFTQCMLYEPFGQGRGTVIAKRGHMLVLALGEVGRNTFFAVAPSKELQDLIWSVSNGLASQWSQLELRAITGLEGWPAVLKMAAGEFAAARRSLERAIAGKPERDVPAVAEMPVFDCNVMEMPPEYLHSFNGTEVSECVH